MPVAFTQSQVKEYLLSNGCELLNEYSNNRTNIQIKCQCGHIRTSTFGRTKDLKQFKCKDCTENRSFQRNPEYIHPKTFEKIKKIFESKYKRTLKYRDDFLPENYNQMLHCWNCNTMKNRRNFPYRKQYALNKEKRCKNCNYKNGIYRRNNRDRYQFTHQMVKSCEQCAIRRKDSGRDECGNFNIDTDFIIQLGEIQNNRCTYSNRELEWGINTDNKCSIDRIDSDKGYTQDNVQLVCFMVNKAKSDMTHEGFLQFIQEIYHKKPLISLDEETNQPNIKKINAMLSVSRASAKKRGLIGREEASTHTLTKEEVIDISYKQGHKCVYTRHNLWNSTEKPSIDRIDSSKGYIKSNIQIITFKANVAKSDLQEDTFMELVKDIYNHSCTN
jgi:hypothetical protein